MIESISFSTIGQSQSEIRLQHSTGEETTFYFNSEFPMLYKDQYMKAIKVLLSKNPDLSPKDDLFNIFTSFFIRCRLDMPMGVSTLKNEERIRIGNRIRELREENHLDAKRLSILTGIDAANLCRIEQGKQSAGIDVLSKIANAMGYKLDFVKL